jgi:peptidoglycan hydrolase CwlO-like protein
MAEPQSLAATHPVEVWTALGGSVTIIIALVTVLWNRQNNDIKAHETKLEMGQRSFAAINETLVKLGEQIAALREEDEFQGEELDRLELDIKGLTQQLTVLQTEHNSCIPRKLSMRGDT